MPTEHPFTSLPFFPWVLSHGFRLSTRPSPSSAMLIQVDVLTHRDTLDRAHPVLLSSRPAPSHADRVTAGNRGAVADRTGFRLIYTIKWGMCVYYTWQNEDNIIIKETVHPNMKIMWSFTYLLETCMSFVVCQAFISKTFKNLPIKTYIILLSYLKMALNK